MMGIFLYLALMQSPIPAWGRGDCMNQCQLVRLEKSQEYSLSCACDSRVSKGERDWLAGRNSADRMNFLKKKILGIDLNKHPEMVNNYCRNRKKTADADLARKKLNISNLDLCDCVSTIQNFPKSKNCRKTPAGEKLCEVSENTDWALQNPGDPTLYAYQVCLIKKETYKKPERCPAKPCDEKIPVCESGTKLVNLADPESCCPVFSCEPVEFREEGI